MVATTSCEEKSKHIAGNKVLKNLETNNHETIEVF